MKNYMMRKISIHNNDEIASCMLDSMNICCSKS